MPKVSDERLLVGLETSDDAAVYKINDELAIIETLDFFTPVVDDPYVFGQIAAANSLSDVYAMGGDPKLVMNISCFPNCLSPKVMAEILRGAHDKVHEAGAMTVGGHTVQDEEPKFGLSVTGFVHPSKILPNNKAREGDILILTKPLGLGVINTVIKAGLQTETMYEEAVKVMSTLNKYAKEVIDKVGGVHSLTDVTGFGLLGHCLEMARGSRVSMEIFSKNVQVIREAVEYAKMGFVPAGAYDNRVFVGEDCVVDPSVPEYLGDLLFDPQTSGGLLISVQEEKSAELMLELGKLELSSSKIGKVCSLKEKYLYVK